MIRSALPKQFACKRQHDETVRNKPYVYSLKVMYRKLSMQTTEGRMHSVDDQVKEVTRVAEVTKSMCMTSTAFMFKKSLRKVVDHV